MAEVSAEFGDAISGAERRCPQNEGSLYRRTLTLLLTACNDSAPACFPSLLQQCHAHHLIAKFCG